MDKYALHERSLSRYTRKLIEVKIIVALAVHTGGRLCVDVTGRNYWRSIKVARSVNIDINSMHVKDCAYERYVHGDMFVQVPRFDEDRRETCVYMKLKRSHSFFKSFFIAQNSRCIVGLEADKIAMAQRIEHPSRSHPSYGVTRAIRLVRPWKRTYRTRR